LFNTFLWNEYHCRWLEGDWLGHIASCGDCIPEHRNCWKQATRLGPRDHNAIHLILEEMCFKNKSQHNFVLFVLLSWRHVSAFVLGHPQVTRYMLFYFWGNDKLIYRVSQEECARLWEGVPYVKVYRYNPKHPCPKLNGYGDNGQRKVWSSGRSTHCTSQLTSLIDVCPWVWCRIQLTLAVQLCSRLIPECAISHVTSVLAIRVSCIVLGILRTNMTCVRVFL